jgi:hypothetical protein
MSTVRLGWITSITTALVACPVSADCKPAAPKEDASRLVKGAAQFYSYVKQPLPAELKWQEIPWMLDLKEGIRLAKEERFAGLLVQGHRGDPCPYPPASCVPS